MTSTSPSCGMRPASSRRWTASIAVKPAVPIAAARCGVMPAGRCTRASGRTRARVAKPPWRVSPIPSPFRTTASPGEKRPSADSVTVPTRSMPGISGWARAMPFPARAIPSL